VSQFEKLFEPGAIGKLRLKNRIISAPMERNYGDIYGNPTQRYIDNLTAKADGGVGLILIEATYVDPLGKGRVLELGLYDDSQIPGYRRLAQEVHKHGAKIGLELVYGGRQSHSNVTGVQAHGPSPVTCVLPGYGELPRELRSEEIPVLVQKYVDAARRSKEAGFDIVELHCAHGYLIAQFMSPYGNKRTDDWGGTFEKRLRFPLEIIAGIRKTCGPDFPIACRVPGDEYVDGGLVPEEVIRIAQRFEAAGADLIDVSSGIYETAFTIVQPMGMPLGCNVHLVEGIKRAVNIPVSIAGRINDCAYADAVLKEGKSDFISMARGLHADPQLPNLSQEGRLDDICMCIGCNQGCIDMLGSMVPVFCAINPLSGRERELAIKPAERKKRVVVVGGGPAGMSAARVAALRGHQVTLYEQEPELGGQLLLGRKAIKRGELEQIVRYLSTQMRKAGVDIHLGEAADKEKIYAANPDVVIMATGAVPYIPFIPGTRQSHVCTYLDILSGKVEPGKRVVVIGGRLIGCQIAQLISAKGSSVVLTEPMPTLCLDAGGRTKWLLLRDVEKDKNIEIHVDTSVEQIKEKSVVLQSRGETVEIEAVDTVVLCLGGASDNALAEELKWESKLPEIHTIGDCSLPRKMTEAIYEGYVTALHI